MRMTPIDLYIWIIVLQLDCLGRLKGMVFLEELYHWDQVLGFQKMSTIPDAPVYRLFADKDVSSSLHHRGL